MAYKLYIYIYALRLCTGPMAHRGSRGIAVLFHDHGTRRGWGVSIPPQPLFTPGKDLVPIIQEAGWAPGLVWTGAENLIPTWIRSLDRPARSQLIYWLCYPAHTHTHTHYIYIYIYIYMLHIKCLFCNIGTVTASPVAVYCGTDKG